MKLKNIVATLCLLVLGISTFSAIGYYNAARETALLENHLRSFDSIAESTEQLESLLRERRLTLARMASANQVTSILAVQSPRSSTGVDQLLAKLQADLPGCIFSLLDRQGNLLASSVQPGPDSFTGRDPAIHEYFQEGMLGRDFAGAAIDKTSGQKDFLLGHSILDPSRTMVVGVAVVRFPVAEIVQAINPDQYLGIFALTGPGGKVLYSNRSRLENLFLWHPPPSDKLSGMNLEKVEQTERVALDEYDKENAQDFALWKKATPEELDRGIYFESPWGPGRPGCFSRAR